MQKSIRTKCSNFSSKRPSKTVCTRNTTRHSAIHFLCRTHIIFVVLISLFCVVLLSSCNKDKKPLSHLETSYDIVLDFADDMKTVALSQEVIFTNTTGQELNEIKFHIYPNAFSETAVASASISGNSFAKKGVASPCLASERSATSTFFSSGDPFETIDTSAYIASEYNANFALPSYSSFRDDDGLSNVECAKSADSDYVHNMKKGDFGGIDVLSVKINRKSIAFAISGRDNTLLTLPYDISNGQTCTIDLEANITIPTCDARFGKTANSINFTGFYPTLSVFENGAWRDEPYYQIGDPFYSNIASFYVNISIPAKYTVATSGSVVDEWQEGGKKCMDIVAENIRDYALVVSDSFQMQTGKAQLGKNSVVINYYYTDDTNSLGTLNLAVSAIETFSAAFGNYPYSHFSVVQSPLNAGGMEYGSLVIIAPMTNRQQADETLVHETAHQWWYGVVGSDQLSNAWLDEGLTEFSTGYYYKLKNNEVRYINYMKGIKANLMYFSTLAQAPPKGAPLNTHLSAFADNYEYVAAAYLKGALLFDTLLDTLGEKKFRKSLATYYTNNTFKIATKESLAKAFEQNNCFVAGIIDDWVAGKVV